ncbi:MAG: 50S ribosomal protein L25 [Deltaproteobacteria bacterium]|jgi:large subunit ribosomal protein L25|nr:50S ribosomal protein L25 [Deltaproteobacteria bacterium]
MGLSTTITAKPRKVGSSNFARRLRRSGTLPAVCYGEGSESKAIELSYAEFKKAFLTDPGNRSLFTLAIEGEGSFPSVVKEYQIHPVTRKLLHVDLVKVSMEKPVTVSVPLALVGKAQGVEKGGQLQQIEREITVKGLPGDIPSEIQLDVTSLALGQTLHLTQIPLPETLSLVKTADLPVALVGVPKGLKSEVELAAAGEAAPAPVAAAKAAPAAKAPAGKGKDKKK